MIVEIRPTGGVLIRALPDELRTLGANIALALVHGRSRAPFMTDTGVAEFVIATDARRVHDDAPALDGSCRLIQGSLHRHVIRARHGAPPD